MRRKDKAIENREEIEAVIRQARLCHLAMCDGDEPYVVALNFGYADDCLYFHCARQGRKLDILAANPKVCFAIESNVRIDLEAPLVCKWEAYFESVIGTGRAEILMDGPEREHGLAALVRHHGGDPATLDQAKVAKTCVIRVRIDSMTGKRSVPVPE